MNLNEHLVCVSKTGLFNKFSQFPDVYGFATGTLDTDPGIIIERHVFTRYKAPWYTITDDLPQIEDLSDTELHDAKNKYWSLYRDQPRTVRSRIGIS